MPKIAIATPPRWTTREVAEHFRTTERSILNWRNNAGLPYLKINPRKILYVPEELAAWAKKRAGNGK
jgi:helix-turn-helix protein